MRPQRLFIYFLQKIIPNIITTNSIVYSLQNDHFRHLPHLRDTKHNEECELSANHSVTVRKLSPKYNLIEAITDFFPGILKKVLAKIALTIFQETFKGILQIIRFYPIASPGITQQISSGNSP